MDELPRRQEGANGNSLHEQISAAFIAWNVTPCSLVQIYRCFTGRCYPLITTTTTTTYYPDGGAITWLRTSVHFNQTTRRHIPQDNLHSHCTEQQ